MSRRRGGDRRRRDRHRRIRALAACAALLIVGSPGHGAATASAVLRIEGPTRFETAVAVSRHLFPRGGAAAVVLARGDAFPDGLAGVPLAHHLGAPLLLTRAEELPDTIAAELKRVLAPGGTVHVLGGATAISPRVTATITALGSPTERHGGSDRYDTAARIAAILPDHDTAVLVSGERFPDALVAGPVAASRGWPILLTRHSRLPTATRADIGSYRRVIVVGGPAAVSDAVVETVAGLGVQVVRVAGATRADTAIAVAGTYTAAQTAVVATGDGFADALTGGVVAARLDAPILFTRRDGLDASTSDRFAERDPQAVRLMGGLAVASEVVVDAIVAALRSDPGAPLVTATDPPIGAVLERLHRVAVTTDPTATHASVSAWVGGARIGGSLRQLGSTWEFEADPLPPLPPGLHPVRIDGAVTGDRGTRYVVYGATMFVRPATARSPEAWTIAPGTGPVVGTGALTRFTVEVEPATGIDVNAIAFAVEDALFDRRSWTATGQVAVQRVDDPAAARVRIVVATPSTVDRWCAPIANTAGRYSCWEGRRVMLNATRWTSGADAFAGDVQAYRRHLVNHEVGHAFGHAHASCPAPGAPAPIMMQQSKGTGGCIPNPWPYP